MTEPEASGAHVPTDDREEAGGEAACALHRVCDACGALEDGPPAAQCRRCGTPRAG